MGFLSAALERRRIGATTTTNQFLSMGWGGTAAGVSVSEEGSLRYSAVFACVRVLAESVASLPLITYRRLPGGGKERAREHALYELLHDAPNPLMTSLEFREAMQAHMLLWGNAYAEIVADGRGNVTELWPLRPDAMEKIEPSGEGLVYTYRLPSGKSVQLPGWQVLHLRGLSSNGIVGYSPIMTAAREAVGKGLAVQQFGSMFFRNGARPGGILSFPGELSAEAMGRIRESWQDHYGGLSNAHRVAILEQGMTYQEVGIPPAAAAYIEDQKMSVLDIARVYRVPPHMIGDLERATFSNIEHQAIEFVTHSLRPWLVRWEQAIQQRLMTERDRQTHLVEFLVDGLLRGDVTSRYQAYAVARQNGWMSANDIRELENQNPIDDGDLYLVPLNMVPAGDVAAVAAVAAGMTPAASPPDTARRLVDGEARARLEKRAAGDRVALARAQRAVLADVMGRVCRRQAQDVGAAARKMLTKRDAATFAAWLEAFYREHEAWTAKAVTPAFLSYGATVAAAAQREVEGDERVYDNEAFMAAYAAGFAAWHVAKTRRKVEAALAHEDALTALEAAAGLWVSEWPEYLAGKEAVQAGNAVAREVYKRNGVTELVWSTTTGEKACSYCDSLDGRVVGIEGKFDIDGLPAFRSVEYPPAHDGCECVIVARKAG
jgi:HK97 family phage portal protein